MLGDTDEQFSASLDAVAGTGKTFTLNILIEKLLETGKSVISAAFAGMTGTLLSGGSNVHSHTNALLNPCKGMKLGIKNIKSMKKNEVGNKKELSKIRKTNQCTCNIYG